MFFSFKYSLLVLLFSMSTSCFLSGECRFQGCQEFSLYGGTWHGSPCGCLWTAIPCPCPCGRCSSCARPSGLSSPTSQGYLDVSSYVGHHLKMVFSGMLHCQVARRSTFRGLFGPATRRENDMKNVLKQSGLRTSQTVSPHVFCSFSYIHRYT